MNRPRARNSNSWDPPSDHFIWSSAAPQASSPAILPRSTHDFLAEKQQYIHQIRRPVQLAQIHFSAAPLNLLSRSSAARQPQSGKFYWTERETVSNSEPLTQRVTKQRGIQGKNPQKLNMAVERLSIENGNPVVLVRNQHFRMVLRRLQGSETASCARWKPSVRTGEHMRRSNGLAKGRISIDTAPSLPLFPLIAVKIAHF